MKNTAMYVAFGASLVLTSAAFAQTADVYGRSVGGVPGAAPYSSTTRGDASPDSGANGSIGGTPGNAAAAGSTAGPGYSGGASSAGAGTYR